MASLRGRINSKESWREWCLQTFDFFWDHKYCQVTISDKRSLDANAAIRVAYKQIQDHKQWTSKETERHCKLTYGVPILRRDDEVQNYVFSQTVDKGNYEQKLKMMDAFSVTSVMSTTQAGEMIECMIQDFSFIVIDKNKGDEPKG